MNPAQLLQLWPQAGQAVPHTFTGSTCPSFLLMCSQLLCIKPSHQVVPGIQRWLTEAVISSVRDELQSHWEKGCSSVVPWGQEGPQDRGN